MLRTSSGPAFASGSPDAESFSFDLCQWSPPARICANYCRYARTCALMHLDPNARLPKIFVLRVGMECRLAARLIALLAQAKQFTLSRVYRTACPPLPERIATGLSSLRWSSRLGLLTAVAVEIFMNNAG